MELTKEELGIIWTLLDEQMKRNLVESLPTERCKILYDKILTEAINRVLSEDLGQQFIFVRKHKNSN